MFSILWQLLFSFIHICINKDRAALLRVARGQKKYSQKRENFIKHISNKRGNKEGDFLFNKTVLFNIILTVLFSDYSSPCHCYSILWIHSIESN